MSKDGVKRRDNPRFKSEKPSKQAQPKILQKHVSDPSLLSRDISDSTKIAAASFLMQFSQMDMSATHFLWDILKLNADDGRLLVSNMDTLDKFELTKKLSERYKLAIHDKNDQAQKVWTDIRQTTQARNKVAHGVWYIVEGDPAVFSYRIPIDAGFINSETFTITRLQNLTKTCEAITLLYEALCLKAQLLHEKSDK